ncbi:YHYH protein [Endozoicomonas sp. SM1973]|uniref:YHYH protein n=1 Tax=Spartinivicinus marinus TaxID=2994442 RepID=A0A853I5C6_9GAMM|nr:YHYH protein [Spartinivicinus marinus]MCX4027739.1 YHYH protein [Spartinivicinus marinus]NYZ68543.1 YHYH protein [Spartinivicinus marinus]
MNNFYKLLNIVFISTVFTEISNAKPIVNTYTPQSVVLNPAYFNTEHFLKNISLVNCTLENNQEALCFELSVKSNPIKDGPYCPKTINDVGGIYIYDGKTNPGLRVLKRDLFEDMEKDGYDIVDDQGNIRFTLAIPGQPPNPKYAYCIEAEHDYSLKLTYYIPAYPSYAAEPTPMSSASNIVGLSLIGLPINGLPPSVVTGPDGQRGGSIPALDPCGGHINEGFYHSHIFPETINNIFIKNHIYDTQCQGVHQKFDSDLIGYAMDGFPIYGSFEFTGIPPTDLDECNGHISPTLHYPWGEYHYHADINSPVNIPTCLKGNLAKDQLVIE